MFDLKPSVTYFTSSLTGVKCEVKVVSNFDLTLTGAKCEVKAMSIFDLAFDSDQRCGKAVTYLTLPLTWVKG